MSAELPPLVVVAVHGLCSSPDILANALSRAERQCTHALSTVIDNGVSFRYPAGTVPMEKHTGIPAAAMPETSALVQYFGWRGGGTPAEWRAAFDAVLADVLVVSGQQQQRPDAPPPLFVLLGHSEGAIVISALLECLYGEETAASRAAYSDHERKSIQDAFSSRCIGLILAGGHRMDDSSTRKNFQFPSLHIIGTRDAVVPPAQSQLLAADFSQPVIFRHDAGHKIPSTKACAASIAAFIAGALRTAEQRLVPAEVRAERERQREQERAALKGLMEEEIEGALMLLPEGSTAVFDEPNNSVKINIVLPGLEDERTLRALYSVRLEEQLKKKQQQQKQRQQQQVNHESDDDDDDDEEVEMLREASEAATEARTGSGGSSALPFVTVTVSLPAERLTLSHLPPLLALQSFKRAQFLLALHESLKESSPDGSGVLLAVSMRCLSELQEWVATSVERVERQDDDDDDETDTVAATDPWRIESTPEERVIELRAINRELDKDAALSPEKLQTNAAAAGGGGGIWRFVTACCGRPSVGKSSFVNAVADLDTGTGGCNVAAHPFTTINSQRCPAFASFPCPCSRHLLAPGVVCAARYGHVPAAGGGGRRHPVEVIDVAGLVAGAYQGRGRGCQFLSDLCSAHCLVHVLDASETSLADGDIIAVGAEAAEAAITCAEDIELIRSEVISWIFENLVAKFADGVFRRRPRKLLTMFSGYGCTLATAELTLSLAGISMQEVDVKVPAMGPSDVLRLACIFFHVRFPTVLACNKMDRGDFSKNSERIARLRARFPSASIVPMSARVETQLQALRRQGVIEYVSGASTFEMVDARTDVSVELEEMRVFLKQNGGTGVQSVLAAAIALSPPNLLFLCDGVDDVVAGRGLSSASSALSECFALRRGTTADGAFKAIAREGHFGETASTSAAAAAQRWSLVRCDVVPLPDEAGPLRRVLCRKDEALPPSCLAKLVFSKVSG